MERGESKIFKKREGVGGEKKREKKVRYGKEREKGK